MKLRLAFSAGEPPASTAPGPKLSNSVSRKPMTEERLARLVAQGFGAGRDEDYKPWIRVTRGLTARKSNIGAYATSVHARCLHLLSTLERRAALVAAWLGASEIREQYPLFPWAHTHPLAGLNATRDSALEPAPALLAIAKRAAIEHGVYPPSLEVLVAGVPDIRSPRGERIYFLRRLPRDPFADPTVAPAQTWGLRAADSPPSDRRPGRDVFDVYSLSEAKALDGSLYRDW